jgi:5-oxopent-3-ene-1,2,5-tricarboxylate decarboxylase / 2-hydroxyhepta-2,4-diene-1,7-dioate isomerase
VLLEGLSTGSIVYCLEVHLGLNGCFMTGVRPVTPASAFVGRARTLRCLPRRSDIADQIRAEPSRNGHRVAIDGVSPGEVLVIDARGVLEAAVMGDILAARVQTAGGAGVVTDGCVRDLPGLVKLDFPVYAAGVHASTFGTRHIGIAVNEPVGCGGVLVMPNDILVGDEEGVVVVPAALEQKVADLCAEQDALDAFILPRVQSGAPLAGTYPPSKELRAEFDQQRQQTR